jgi:peptide chain release factor 3
MDFDAVLRGEITPMFFASAMSNFGVELFLQQFVEYAARPGVPCTGTR